LHSLGPSAAFFEGVVPVRGLYYSALRKIKHQGKELKGRKSTRMSLGLILRMMSSKTISLTINCSLLKVNFE